MILEEAIGFQGEASPLYKAAFVSEARADSSWLLSALLFYRSIHGSPTALRLVGKAWNSTQKDWQAAKAKGCSWIYRHKHRMGGSEQQEPSLKQLSFCFSLLASLSWRCKSCPRVPWPLKHVMGKSIS